MGLSLILDAMVHPRLGAAPSRGLEKGQSLCFVAAERKFLWVKPFETNPYSAYMRIRAELKPGFMGSALIIRPRFSRMEAL
jgi:hypothetical protein